MIYFRDGDVGSWSSFALRLGQPEQTVRVIPSTAGRTTWVINPAGCPSNDTSDSLMCTKSRGGVFDPGHSSSWDQLGNHSLGLEANFGYDNLAALYGLDTVSLGDFGGPPLDTQLVATLAAGYPSLGLFGLNHQSTNLSNFSKPHTSYLTSLKERNLIPSLSWAYTAGASYSK